MVIFSMHELYWHNELRFEVGAVVRAYQGTFREQVLSRDRHGRLYAEHSSRIVSMEKDTQCYDSGVEWNRLRRRIERKNDA